MPAFKGQLTNARSRLSRPTCLRRSRSSSTPSRFCAPECGADRAGVRAAPRFDRNPVERRGSRRARCCRRRDLRHRPAHRGRRVCVTAAGDDGARGVRRRRRARGQSGSAEAGGARVVTEMYFSTCGHCVWCASGVASTCARSGARSARSSTAGSLRDCLCRRGNLHRITDWLDASRGIDDRAARMFVAMSLLYPGESAPAIRCSSSGQARSGYWPRRWHAQPAAGVHVRGTSRDVGATRGRCRHSDSALSTTDDVSRRGEFDVVVECSGNGPGMAFAFESARRGARYVQIGLAGKPVKRCRST